MTYYNLMTYEQREDLIALYKWGIREGLNGLKNACPGVIKLMRNDFETCELPNGHDGDHYNKRIGRWHVSS